MAKTVPLAGPFTTAWLEEARPQRAVAPARMPEMSRHLLWLISARAAVLFLGINLARPLGILPERLFALPFLPFFNGASVVLTLAYLALWWNGRRLALQLYAQIALDLVLASMLVAHTGGLDSPFVSFYLLIIIYCSLTLGRGAAVAGAAVSTILFAGVVVAGRLGLLGMPARTAELDTLSFRVSLNALGFMAVAFLGTFLSRRLQRVQEQLEEKIDSLRQLQKLNDLIVSNIRSGLVTTDLDGNITLFNNAAEELTGTARPEVLHKPVRSVFGEAFWDKIAHADLLRNLRPLRHEDWVELPPDRRRFLGFSVSPLMDHERRLIGYIVSFQDLTEMKELEEEIRVKDRLATVGRMAAGIAHEIRNPLTSMRGSVEILRSRARLQKSEQRLLEIMMRESDRLNEFVEDLLYFTRSAKYPRRPVDMAALLRDSVTLLRNHPEVRDRHTIELLVPDEPIVVVGNADKLKQVFWNLCQNALRAMPNGGPLTIRAWKSNDGGARVAFEDRGVGMAPEEQARLFEPFHSGFPGGTGLGLSIVFQILEDHGGRLQIESEPGKGTRVTVHLPAPSGDSPCAVQHHVFSSAG